MEAVRRPRDLLPGVRCEKIAAIRDLTMKIMMNPMMFNVFLSLEMMDKMVI